MSLPFEGIGKIDAKRTMSSAMSFGQQGGSGIQKLVLTMAPATSATWAGMPVLVVVLLGGFIVNAGWCIVLNIRNKTAGDYVAKGVPVVPNLVFAGAAGAIMLGEWKGTSKKTMVLLAAGLVLLIASAVVAGYGGYLGQKAL